MRMRRAAAKEMKAYVCRFTSVLATVGPANLVNAGCDLSGVTVTTPARVPYECYRKGLNQKSLVSCCTDLFFSK